MRVVKQCLVEQWVQCEPMWEIKLQCRNREGSDDCNGVDGVEGGWYNDLGGDEVLEGRGVEWDALTKSLNYPCSKAEGFMSWGE
jgi:hypothetical protein